MRFYLAEIKELRKGFVESYKEGDFKKALFLGEHLLEVYRKNGVAELPGYGEDMHNVAVTFDELGIYEKATEYYTRAAGLKKASLGKSASYADTLNNLAIAYTHLERNDVALELHKKVFKVREAVLGLGHIDTIYTLYHLGNIYAKQKQFPLALESYEMALENCHGCQALQLTDMADIHTSMAACFAHIGNYKKAIYYYEFGLDVIERRLGTRSFPYITNALSLAFVFEKVGLTALAIEYCQRSLDARGEMFSKTYLDYVNCLSYLAALHLKEENFEKAFHFYEVALSLVETRFGQNDIVFFEILDKMAICLCKKRDFVNALQIAENTLVLRKIFLPEEITQLAKNYIHLGQIAVEQGDGKVAFQHFNEAVLLLEKDMQSNKRALFWVCSQIADLFARKGAYETAAFLFELIMKENRGCASFDHELDIFLMTCLSLIHINQEEYTKAVLICTEMKESAKLLWGKDHCEYAEVLKNLGVAYQKSGDLVAAEKNFEKALEIQKEVVDEDNPIYIKTLEVFAEVCFMRGDCERAIALYKERNDMNFEETPQEQREAACTLLAIGVCYLRKGEKEKAKAYVAEAEGKLLRSGLMPNENYVRLRDLFEGGTLNLSGFQKTVRRRMKDKERKDLEETISSVTDFYGSTSDAERLENAKRVFAAFSLGEMHQRLGNKEQAVYWFTLAEKKSDPECYIRTCTRLAEVYFVYGEIEKALQKFINVREYISEYGDPFSMEHCHVLGFIGDCFYKKGKNDTAITFYHAWDVLYKELALPECLARDSKMEKMGKILSAVDRLQEAADLYYALAVSVRNREGETERFGKFLLRTATLKIQLGNQKEAEPLLDHVLLLAGKNGITTESFGRACDKIGRLYHLCGLAEKALEALKMAYEETIKGKKCMTKEGKQLLCELLWKKGDSTAYFSVKNGREVE